MNEPRDNELSHIYKEGTWPEPSRQIDEAILSASRRAARARHPFVWRWAPSLALAATVVLTVSLVLRVYQDQPQTVSPPIPDGRSAPILPTTEPPAEKPKSVPAPQSAPAPAQKPAPAASAVALKKEASQAKRSDQARREIQENLRERYQSSPPQELQPEIQPEPMRAPPRANEAPSPPPAQIAPRAAVISGGDAGAISIRRTDAPERSPQAWLEDIRRLKAEGKPEEAGREIAEFRKRYPDYVLPDDLR